MLHGILSRGYAGVWLTLLIVGFGAWAEPPLSDSSPGTALPWDREALFHPPAFHPAEGFSEPEVEALYFDGLRYQGKPTRVFAWYGKPALEKDTKAPAMVLVHGGGGTAFAEWVRLWTRRGYAAIAMDTCGAVPKGTYNNWERLPDGGPAGWGGLDQMDRPLTDQWTYHAVADIILAHSLLRSFPEVDPDRIGITGISWGGFLTCIVAGIDTRFRCAVPVYGCGYIYENSSWLEAFQQMPELQRNAWIAHWDPSHYLARAAMPMLWVTGTNDFAYPLDSLQHSYRTIRGDHTLSIRMRMPHGHGGAGENPEEIHAFADHFLKNGPALPKILEQGADGGSAWVTYDIATPVVKAELTYTCAEGKWADRPWEAVAATVDTEKGRVSASLPEKARVYYFNLYDAQERLVSSDHVLLPQ